MGDASSASSSAEPGSRRTPPGRRQAPNRMRRRRLRPSARKSASRGSSVRCSVGRLRSAVLAAVSSAPNTAGRAAVEVGPHVIFGAPPPLRDLFELDQDRSVQGVGPAQRRLNPGQQRRSPGIEHDFVTVGVSCRLLRPPPLVSRHRPRSASRARSTGCRRRPSVRRWRQSASRLRLVAASAAVTRSGRSGRAACARLSSWPPLLAVEDQNRVAAAGIQRPQEPAHNQGERVIVGNVEQRLAALDRSPPGSGVGRASIARGRRNRTGASSPGNDVPAIGGDPDDPPGIVAQVEIDGLSGRPAGQRPPGDTV